MAKFKPEFGNEKHIRVAKLLKKLSDTDKKLETKIREVASTKKLAEEMREIIKQVIFLLEEDK